MMNRKSASPKIPLFALVLSITVSLLFLVTQAATVAAQAPRPHMDVFLDNNRIAAYEWPIGASLTLTIVDAQNGPYTVTVTNGTSPWAPTQGYYQFEIPQTYPVRPGQQVTITDGTTPASTTVADLQAPTIDMQNHQIRGTAAAGARLWINLCNQDGCANRWVLADASAAYLFDFDRPGLNPGEDTTVQLHFGDSSSINWSDANGHNTSRNWRIPNPNILANATKRWINAREWPTGETLTLRINGVFIGTDIVEAHSWSNGEIYANFNPPQMQAGDTITISNPDGSITKSLTLIPIQMTNISLAASTLSGTTLPNASLTIGMSSEDVTRHIQADAQGNWTASFATPGGDPRDHGTATFGPKIEGWITNMDSDGDQTNSGWASPTMDVILNSHSVAAYNWEPGTSLTLTVTNPAGQPYTATVVNGADNWETILGYYQFMLPMDFPLNPGQQVIVTSGALSRTTTIQNLPPPAVDLFNSRISGTTGPGVALTACVRDVTPCIPRSVTADANGNYIIDFSIPGGPGEEQTYQFRPSSGGYLHRGDGNGNNTSLYWNAPSYALHVNPHDEEVHGHEWPLGDQVTLQIVDPVTGAQVTTTTTVVDTPNQCGLPCFWMDNLGWTLAPGQVVTLSDAHVTKTVTVSPLAVTRIDVLHDQIAGVATPGSNLIAVDFSSARAYRSFEADQAGNWFVDFSVPGQYTDQGTLVDLTDTSAGRVIQVTPPGWPGDDGTLAYWQGTNPILLSAVLINENVPASSVVGTFSPAFPELPQALVYSLTAGTGDTDNSAFTINGNQLRINASPNYESKSTYAIRVRVIDTNAPGKSHEVTYTITVNDLNEPPTNIALNPAVISENAPAGSTIGTLTTYDPDAGQTFAYSLVSGDGSTDNAVFSISNSNLILKASPDFETQSTYRLRVRATQNGVPAQFLEREFTVLVTNQVEAPIVTGFTKSGVQGSPLSFTAADFSDRFVNLETSSTGILEKIKISTLPAYGTLRVGSGPSLTVDSEVLAANFNQLVYTPNTANTTADQFLWNGANSAGYATNNAQVTLNLGFAARYGLQISPAGDAKQALTGTSAVYTLFLTNTGNTPDSYTIALQNSPMWPTTFTPAQVANLPPGARAMVTVSVTVPIYAAGSDSVVLRVTSQADTGQAAWVQLTTIAVGSPIVRLPVLLGVSPGSAGVSELPTTILTLHGANFTSPMTVRIGNLNSPYVTLNSSVELVARVPAGLAPGRYPVVVCSSAGCTMLPDAFTVLNSTPIVHSVYPSYGHNDTTNQITVAGENLSAQTTFSLVGAIPNQQPYVIQAFRYEVRLNIPSGLPAGTYDLRVCNQGMCSTRAGAYTSLTMIKNDFAAAQGDLWTSPVTVREGNTILIGLNVHHVSGIGFSSVQVAFYRDEPNVPANKISPQENLATPWMVVGNVEQVSFKWTPVGVTGPVQIFAVIDPDGLMTEATRSNNIVSTIIQVLPREANDETPPLIQALAINNGAVLTSQNQVNITLQAVDNPGGSGLQSMNLVEREFNSAARQWIVVQETGWIPYQGSFQLNLSERGGMHYIQAWVADRAGNASELAQVAINYHPAQASLAAGSVSIYRFHLAANDQQHILLQTLAGDADLYVWDPDGNLVGASTTLAATDRVDFTARTEGLYQVEVYAAVDSTYAVNFQAAAPGMIPAAVKLLNSAMATPQRWQAMIMPQNEPLIYQPAFHAPITAWDDTYWIFLPAVRK